MSGVVPIAAIVPVLFGWRIPALYSYRGTTIRMFGYLLTIKLINTEAIHLHTPNRADHLEQREARKRSRALHKQGTLHKEHKK